MSKSAPLLTVNQVINQWLEIIYKSKSKNTWKTYQYATSVFRRAIGRDMPIADLSDSHYDEFLVYLKGMQPRTEKLVATIMALFFEYLSAKSIVKINTDAIRYMRRNETRKVGKRIRKMDMPSLQEIANKVVTINSGNDVLLARAKALVILLCRSGLRAFEAAGLTNEDLDKKSLRGKIIGKGDKEALFIIDQDTINALEKYHRIRKVKSQYLFISHSKRDIHKEPRPIDTDTTRRDVIKICQILLDHEPKYKITPHQFRHYFVTQIWRESHDIKLSQSLARHDNIQTTEGYIHTDETDMDHVVAQLKKSRSK